MGYVLLWIESLAVSLLFVATLVACVLGMLLVLTGWWQYLWILFGGANQLMASLALLIITLWLVSQKRSVAFAFVPMVFMFITTIAALGYTAYSLMAKVAAGKVAGSARVGNGLMAVVALFLVAAALVLAADGWRAFRRYRAQRADVAAEQT
jgi:carbon starvation protein